jgi:hypothetical protein
LASLYTLHALLERLDESKEMYLRALVDFAQAYGMSRIIEKRYSITTSWLL